MICCVNLSKTKQKWLLLMGIWHMAFPMCCVVFKKRHSLIDSWHLSEFHCVCVAPHFQFYFSFSLFFFGYGFFISFSFSFCFTISGIISCIINLCILFKFFINILLCLVPLI
ncbi:hypothetical protein AAHE18_14G080400 [Arachis hypogaea]